MTFDGRFSSELKISRTLFLLFSRSVCVTPSTLSDLGPCPDRAVCAANPRSAARARDCRASLLCADITTQTPTHLGVRRLQRLTPRKRTDQEYSSGFLRRIQKGKKGNFSILCPRFVHFRIMISFEPQS